MSKALERIYNGLIKENPTFVLTLGMCPTLAVTTSAINGAGMGLSTMVVLILSNVFISLLRKIIPDKVRIPAFIVIIASFVTIVQLLLQGYVPSLYDSLGIYIPLIVVNCIILGRAEAYAYSNPVIPSFFDGLGMGLGFTVALTLIGACRELLGAGQLFGCQILGADNVFYQVSSLRPLAMFLGEYTNISIFIMAPGAFFVLAFIIAAMNRLRRSAEKKGKRIAPASDCTNCLGKDCAGCAANKDQNAADQSKTVQSDADQAKAEGKAEQTKTESDAEQIKTDDEKAEQDRTDGDSKEESNAEQDRTDEDGEEESTVEHERPDSADSDLGKGKEESAT
ncbi:MAG: electron transport complex subunit RsxE [Lachnospiraceae bacterium]|nr:electron transport complex subunit RsxE [Lachnospiraceae bacterium]